ncbi:hypothetical protein [Leisingera sp. ANG-S5]|uniref:hypothetical protein n=1 Tax=Leisingera sp. ANG-S5 TaxID=1577901 RepID=UPI0005807DA4|nr:hypothetical protein [Leisingera sp. ANG-S5]KIC32105.1 hypothetical protein RA25_13660 [Leisingera sp. ANG-S5]
MLLDQMESLAQRGWIPILQTLSKQGEAPTAARLFLEVIERFIDTLRADIEVLFAIGYGFGEDAHVLIINVSFRNSVFTRIPHRMNKANITCQSQEQIVNSDAKMEAIFA